MSAGATFVSYWTQLMADSGILVYEKLLLKVILANLVWITVYFLLKTNVHRRWLSIILLASAGAFLNLVLTSLVEVCQAYYDKASQAMEPGKFSQLYIKHLAMRFLLLTPLDAVIFLIVFVTFYCALQLVDKLIASIKSHRME